MEKKDNLDKIAWLRLSKAKRALISIAVMFAAAASLVYVGMWICENKKPKTLLESSKQVYKEKSLVLSKKTRNGKLWLSKKSRTTKKTVSDWYEEVDRSVRNSWVRINGGKPIPKKKKHEYKRPAFCKSMPIFCPKEGG